MPTETRRGGSAAAFGRARAAIGKIPPTGLELIAMSSVQVGAALAKSLFAALGPGGTVFLRVGFAALALLLVWRPRLRAYGWSSYWVALLFGAVLAAMNFSFYLALSRIPLGVAVTVEFVGPLAVAVFGSRRPLDVLWVILAASGILLLAPLESFKGAGIDPVGLGLALLAGACWAGYILLMARVGRVFAGGDGLALAVGAISAGTALLNVPLLLAGAGVALLSSVIPYSLELEVLRRLPPRVFGILMSLEPGLAAFFGFALLHEQLSTRALAAILLVSAASVGAARFGRQKAQEPGA